MKKILIAEGIVILLSLIDSSRARPQAPLEPPLPGGSTYLKGRIVSQLGLGIIGCSNQQIPLADASGCVNISSIGGAIIPGTNITCSPNVGGECSGTVTINATSSGGSAIPANAGMVWTGTSIVDDDNATQAPQLAITSIVGTDIPGADTIEFSMANALTVKVGDWLSMRGVTNWPVPPSPINLGTGYTLFQVAAINPVTRVIVIAVSSSFSFADCTSSCGYLESAENNIPYVTARQLGMPASMQNNVTTLIAGPTLAVESANFNSLFTSMSPSVTGKPSYLIISDPWNDILSCATVAQVEGYYTAMFSAAHTLGYKVVIPSVLAKSVSQQYGSGLCSYPVPPYQEIYTLSNWLYTQGPTNANILAGTNWDIWADVAGVYNDGYSTSLAYGSPSAWLLYGSIVANSMYTGNGTAESHMGLMFGNSNGTQNASTNGYVIRPSQDSYGIFQVLNAEGVELFRINSSGNQIWLDSATFVSGSLSAQPFILQASTNDSNLGASLLAAYQVNQQTSASALAYLSIGQSNNCLDSAAYGFTYVGGNDSNTNLAKFGVYCGSMVTVDGNGNMYVPGKITSVGGSDSLRAGSWLINGATSVAVTFAHSGASVTNCTVSFENGSGSGLVLSNGAPNATGFTVYISPSGTANGNYVCVQDNAD